jgi:hypothetical protein
MGKSAIIYVIGLSLIVGITLMNVNRSSTDSMATYTQYYGRTMAHNIALTGANIGTNYILFNVNYSTAFSDSFAGGVFSVQYDSTAPMSKELFVQSAYNTGGETIRDTIYARFQYIMFSRYGWFTELEQNGYRTPLGGPGPYSGYSDWKITGDSVFGYAHTNGRFNLDGRPYFDKKVTAGTAAVVGTLTGPGPPAYNDGYQWGISIQRDSANIGSLRSIANAGAPGTIASLMTGNDVGLEFYSNGNVRIRVPWNTGNTKDTVMAMTALTTSQVIGVKNADLHIKGTYSGQVTVAAFSGASGPSTNKGNVWVDGNVVANDNPRTNPNSTDMLGIVAERMAYITKDLTRNTSSILDIQAAIYCHNGELTAEDFWTIPKSGRVSLFGGVTQKTAGSLGVFGSGGILNGYFYSIRHDPRFLAIGPPKFPFSRRYRLIAWWEN